MGKEFSFFLSQVLLTALIICASPSISKGQGAYRSLSNQYQKWLRSAGFSKVLKVSKVERHEGMLYFYLDFRYERIDSTIAAWEILKRKFTRRNGFDMEQNVNCWRARHLHGIKIK